MNKAISVILILTSILLTFAVTLNSGIKFGLDTEIFKLVKKMNLNKFAQNKTLVNSDGYVYSSPDFPSYKIRVANLNITNVGNPASEVVRTRVDPNSDTKFLEISLERMQIDLTTDFDIEVISYFKDQGRNTPIRVFLDRIDGEIYFNNGNVHFTKFQVQIGQIDIKFNSFWFKTIYYLGSKLIISSINTAVSNLHDNLEKSLNEFITSQWLIDVGLGIGINATNVDRPQLEIFEKSRMDTRSSVEKVHLNFLEGPFDRLKDEAIYSTILEFGIYGSLYPNLNPELQAEVAPASQMDYSKNLLNNKLSILISDYSVNTLLFMGQQTGAIKKVLTNSTNDILPFNIDTEGMSGLILELAQKYNETKEMEFKIYVNPIGYKQPELNSDLDGATLSLNFGIEFNVFESDDPFDDAVTQLKANVNAHVKFQYLISNNQLSLILFKTTVDQIITKKDELNVNMDNFKSNLENTLNVVMETFKPMLTNIDVAGLLKENFNADFNNLIVNTKQNYTVFSVDIEDL